MIIDVTQIDIEDDIPTLNNRFGLYVIKNILNNTAITNHGSITTYGFSCLE